METIKIECPKIFDYDQCLAYFKRDENEVLFYVVDQEIYRALYIDGNKILIRVSYEYHHLIVEILNDVVLSPSNIERLITFVAEWFDLATDLSSFYELGKNNQILAPLIEGLYGLRLIRIPDFFEAISWGIIGQQINLTFAYQLKRNFVEKYGEKIEYQASSYYIHPSAEKVAQLNVEDLTALKFSRRKAEYLIGIAKSIHAQMLTKEQLLKMDDEKEVEKTLVNMRGIGPWTAHYVMMRSLGIKNAYPIGDVGLQNALKTLLKLDNKPTQAHMMEINESWEKWSSYATFYIWRAPYIGE